MNLTLRLQTGLYVSLREALPLPTPMADVPGHKEESSCSCGTMWGSKRRPGQAVGRTAQTTTAMQAICTGFPLPFSLPLRTLRHLFYNTAEKHCILPTEP